MIKLKDLLKEYTDSDFSGQELISKTKQPDMFGQQVFDEFFPKGSKSTPNAIKALKASDKSITKQQMGRHAPMFVHVSYIEFETDAEPYGENYFAHMTQYYNSNFKERDPDFNPRVTLLSLYKVEGDEKEPIGSILVKTDELMKDLKNLVITKRAS